MSRISTYPIDSAVNVDDLLIGTDSVDSNITKNYSILSIVGLSTLQAVLDAGNTATQTINLTGTVNSTDVQTVGMGVTGAFTDTNSQPGTANDVLTSTGTAVDWSDTLTLSGLTVNGVVVSTNTGNLSTVPVTFVKMNNLGSSVTALIVGQGVGTYIQVLSATYKLTSNTTPFSFTTDLTIGTETSVQFVLPFAAANLASTGAAVFHPYSIATGGVLGENEALVIGSASNPTTTDGDAGVEIDIIYRVITV
tara:strand:- start:51 stop:803 length:753 start_codon:yes stop_codon:yes gene_type:complete